MPKLTPVDFDPFADDAPGPMAAPMAVAEPQEVTAPAPAPRLTPVDFNPFPEDPLTDSEAAVRARLDAVGAKLDAKQKDRTALGAMNEFGRQIGDALVGGAEKTGIYMRAAKWLAHADDDDADELADAIAIDAEAAPERPDYADQFDADLKDAGWRYENAQGTRDRLSAIGEAIGTVVTSPRAVVRSVADQAGNIIPGLGGAAAGAAAGSLAGPVGTAVGGYTGMAAGSVATEAGAKLIEMVQGEGVDIRDSKAVARVLKSPGFREKARKAGLIKGGVIAAVDLATMKMAGKVLSGPARQLENAVTGYLAREGVDIANKEAVSEALASPAAKAALAPAFAKYAAQSTVGRRAGRAAGAVGIETLGEGVGEGVGQVASGGETSFADIAQEMIGSLGQSALQAGAEGAIQGANQFTGRPEARSRQPDIEMGDEPSIADLIGEDVTAPNTPLRPDVAPDAATAANADPVGSEPYDGTEVSTLSPTDLRIREIRDAINAGRPVPPGARGQAQELETEDVELAPPPEEPPKPALRQAAEELAAAMRERRLDTNIDVEEIQAVLEAIEAAQAPADAPVPKWTPPSNVEVDETDIEDIDAAQAPLDIDQEDLDPEQVELAPPPARPPLDEAADELQRQMRPVPPAANVDVTEQDLPVEQIEGAPPPNEPPPPPADGGGPPAANIDVEEDELIDMDAEAAQLANERAQASRAGRFPPGWTDARLGRAQFRYGLRKMADDLVEGGGVTYKRDDNDIITGRTPSLNPQWFQGVTTDPKYKMSVKQVKAAVEKALKGEKLGLREQRMVGLMIDIQTGERREQVDYARQELEAARRFRKTAAEAIGITDDDVAHAAELFEEQFYPADWDSPTRTLFELANEARAVDRKAADAILESGAGNTAVARRLLGVIHGRTDTDVQSRPGQAPRERETEDQAEAPPAEADAPRADDEAVESDALVGATRSFEQSVPNESVTDSAGIAVQLGRNLSESKTGGAKSFGDLDIKTQRQMKSRVIAAAHDRKIREEIIGLIPVDVMNDLGGGQGAAKRFLDNPSVLTDSFSSAKPELVISTARFFNALSDAPASVRAKVLGRSRGSKGSLLKDPAAIGAGDVNSSGESALVAGGTAKANRAASRSISLSGNDLAARSTSDVDSRDSSNISASNRAEVSGGENLRGVDLKDDVASKTGGGSHSKIILDFGEKLEGARKDYAATLKDAMDVDVASAPLSKSWPEPDYQKLLEGGASPWTVAWAHAMRDEIPAKPAKSYKVKRWVEQVTMLRGMAEKLISGEWREETARTMLDRAEFATLKDQVGGRAELYMAVGHDTSLKGIGLKRGEYGVFNGVPYSPAKVMWSVEKRAKATAYSNWPTMLAYGDTREAAIAAFKAKVGELTEKPEKDVSFSIYSYRNSPKQAVIGKKTGKGYLDLKTFDSVKEARAYLAEHKDELVAMLEKAKATPSERRETNEARVGVDHRGGADVTPEQFAETFGFRGVQFGNYVENSKRQADLNEAYDALLDLAGIIGVPPRALSLNGELGLAFGARGRGGKGAFAAHYERETVVINLTKERGAGALAHEWWHSLDNYFGRMGGQKESYPTEGTAGIKGVREPVLQAFRAVRSAVGNAALKARANALDARRSKAYWSTGREMSARAFEAYVIAKLQDQGQSNDYLANIVSEAYWKAQEALFHAADGKDTYPYPTADEIPPIRAAFDEFFRTVETRETEKGVAIYEPEQVYTQDDEQVESAKASYGFNPDQLDLFTAPERKAHDRGRVAADEILRRNQGSVLANGIARDFKVKGFTSLVGQKIKTDEDLAVLAQVYRDPRFETLRYIVTNAAGKVIYQTGVTTRMPSSANAVPDGYRGSFSNYLMDTLIAAQRNLGKREKNMKVWLLHNHPSGNPNSSSADNRLTREVAGMLSTFVNTTFAGHVVIDTNAYTLIDKNGDPSLKVLPVKQQDYSVDEPKVPHAILDQWIFGGADLAKAARMLQKPSEDNAIIIGTNAPGKVSLVTEIAVSSLSSSRGLAILHRLALDSGSHRLFAVGVSYKHEALAGRGFMDGPLTDVIFEDGKSLGDKVGMAGGHQEFGKKRSRSVAEETARYARMERIDTANGPAFDGEDIALFPQGKVPGSTDRYKFLVVDSAGNSTMLGVVTLGIKDGQVTRLHNIVVPEGQREKGVGTRILRSILDTSGGSIEIRDIADSALKFWKKVGTYDIVETERSRHGTLTRDAYERATGAVGRGRKAVQGTGRQAGTGAARTRGSTPEAVRGYLERKLGRKAVAKLIDSGLLALADSTSAQAPADVRRAARSGQRVFGYFDGRTSWLFTDNLSIDGQAAPGTRDAYGILMHELGVHFGMRQMLGERLFKEVIEAAQNATGELGEAMARVRRSFARTAAQMHAEGYIAGRPQEDTEAEIREEHVAWLVTDAAARETSLGRRIIAKLRAFLVKLGFVRFVSTDTLVELARGAAMKAAGQRLNASGVETPAYADASDIRFAREVEPEVAEAIRPAAAASRRTLKQRARAVVDMIDAKTNPLATLSGRTDYLKSRYLTLGRIAQSQQTARRIYDTFRGLSDADGQKVYAYLTDAEGVLEGVSPTVKANATRVKAQINEVGMALVERGVIPLESFEKHQGRYLPRIYLAYLLGDRAVAAVGAGKTLSTQGYAKRRNDDLPQEYRDVVLGEIKDPAFLASKALGVPLRDMAIMTWLTQIAENPAWALPKQVVEWTMPGFDKPRKVTPYWLKSEATRLRERAEFYQGQNKTDALALAAEMDEVGDAALREAGISGADMPEGYKQIPNSGRYGALRGLVVKAEIYDDLVGLGRIVAPDSSVAEKVLGYGGWGTKAVNLWKWSKVAANPPAQVRNVISNFVLLNLSGVSMHRLPGLIARAAKEVRTKGRYWQIGQKYGITESSFAAQEMQRIERETLDYLARQKGRFSLAQMAEYFGRFRDWTGDMYQASEMLGKLVKIIDSMEREGKAEADAAMAAQEWLFDYSLVGQNTRYLRNAPIGAPFLTFAIKVLPRLLEVAITAPWRFLPYVGLFYAASLAVQSMTGADDDDLEALRKALPEFLQKAGHAMIIPVKDEHGRWQFVDLGYFFPWTYWTDFAHGVGAGAVDLVTKGEAGKLGEALTGTGILGGPIPDLLAAIKTGKDPFTGNDIVKEGSTTGDAWAAWTAYLWNMAMPTWLAGIVFHDQAPMRGAAAHIYEAISGEVDKRGEPRSTLPQALARLVGVNVYGVDPVKSRQRALLHKKHEISRVKQMMNSIARDQSLDKETRDSQVQAYKAKIQRMVKDMQDYAKESVAAPELR